MTQPVRVKICGVTSVADAVEAARLGADAVGLILSKQSPRSVNPQDVPAIRRQLPPFVEAVGVFTDARTLCDLYLKLDLKYVQWHGELSELPEFTPGALAMFRLIVAFRIRDRKTLTEAECWLETIPEWAVPAAILIDGFKKDEPGRTGARTTHPGRRLDTGERRAGNPHRAPLCRGCRQRCREFARQERPG
jgi:phosphoribosylanthranilate isomerase